MGNMKYKVGNKVRIKSIDWYHENKDEYDVVDCGAYDFTPGMTKFCGEIITIVGCYANDCYMIKEDDNDYVFTSGMIEGLAEEEMSLDKAGQITDFEYEGLAYTLPDGYQFVDENGNVINATKIVLEKKKPKYPKTYEECCKVMGVNHTNTLDICEHCDYKTEITYYEDNLLEKIEASYCLYICRDAYWKIAGEEMGLGKPWKPDWNDEKQLKYGLCNILKDSLINTSQFIFPTEEMRDAFKENFDPDIEICKVFL